ncbi:hypothetical protein BJV82DRAFT_667532 [Fennellomyces sp. T-0311]|nr:hypothetical protein BJV82DRAFT_667532 [Fennellomyces sp. T-0311]
MPRNNPCRDCKKRRRKCVWIKDSNICTRCTRLGLDCAPFEDPGSEDDELPAEDGNKEVQYWLGQISKLENEMRELELYIQQTTASGTMATPPPDTFSVSDLTVSTIKEELHENMLEQPEWKLSVVDGVLRLETGINSIDELLTYTQASLRYLSPFNSFFQNESVHFESSSVSIIMRALRLMSRKIMQRPLVPLSIHCLPVLFDHNAIIDQLVTLYISHQNPCFPLLHIPTYIKHYRQLKDPLTCPVTLAICINTVCSSRRIVGYTAVEKRQLAEFFYTRCKDMVVDVFDDPMRRLEIVATVSLIQHYVAFVMLQFHEARRLATMAYLLCQELESSYNDGTMAPLFRVIFERHYLVSESFMRALDMMIEDTIDDHLPSITHITTVDDEDKTTHGYVQMFNHILRFTSSPYMANIFIQIKRLINGQDAEFSIDSIMRFSDMLMEWWCTVPTHMRLCEDPFAEDAGKQMEQSNCKMELMMFAILHCISMVTHACILKPTNMESNGEVLMVLRERSLSSCLRSCELALHTIKRRLKMDADLPPMTFEVLINSMYALSAVSSCGRPISANIQNLFYQCFNDVNSFFPSDHRIPPSLSPLKSLMTTRQIHDPDIYEKYPLPGYAFIADVLNLSFIHIQSHFHGTPSPSPSPYSRPVDIA